MYLFGCARSQLWQVGFSLPPAGSFQLQRTGSVVVAGGLSCPEASGIFLDQGSNSRLPALGAWSLNCWTTGGSPNGSTFKMERLTVRTQLMAVIHSLIGITSSNCSQFGWNQGLGEQLDSLFFFAPFPKKSVRDSFSPTMATSEHLHLETIPPWEMGLVWGVLFSVGVWGSC